MKLVAALEGFQPKPYRDHSGLIFIGFGHRLTAEEAAGPYKDGITRDQAMNLLEEDLRPLGDYVDKVVKVDISPDQRDALVAVVWNIGKRRFERTILVRLNAGDYAGVPEEFAKLNRSSDPNGIIMRRAAEAKLWSRPPVPK